MRIKNSISVPLKLLLLGILLSGCQKENKSSLPQGYLTSGIEGAGTEVVEFSGTIMSESKPSGMGAVNLEVKVESAKGETIEFRILNYKKDKVYLLGKSGYQDDWIEFPIAESSGSLRILLTGRFFPQTPPDNTIRTLGPGITKYTF